MHVALLTDRPGIAELLSDHLNGFDDITFSQSFRSNPFKIAQGSRCEHGACPGAKIFRRKIEASSRAQIIVDVAGTEAVPVSIGIDVLE